MKTTRKDPAPKLIDYLYHRITLADLVDRPEISMMEADFEEKDYDNLRDMTGRLGLADVKSFGLTREDCERFLERLGYRVRSSYGLL